MNDLKELIYKMECKGYDGSEIHFWIDCIWMLNVYIIRILPASDWEKADYEKKLAQAHIEIDFTGYKKR